MTRESGKTLEIPEPFRSALAGVGTESAGDADANSPEALYGRALVRMRLGRDRAAREDLVQAEGALGDACTIELAYLQLRENRNLKTCVVMAASVADRAGPGTKLRGRALHVMGHAHGKLRDTSRALGALLEAQEIYRELGERASQAAVQDTLGMLFAARGQLEQALAYYSLSLVQKSLGRDEYGTAMTLGNLGRVHLRAGRCADALDCFRLDLEIAERIGDRRGQARMRNDIGRTLLALGRLEEAERELVAALDIAASEGYADMTFFVQKDTGLVLLGQGRLEESNAALTAAEETLGMFSAPYTEIILLAARGSWQLEAGHPEAISNLEKACEAFGEADMPDLEIPTLMTLAEAHFSRENPVAAESCLRRALLRARADGYARYLPDIREAMERLAVLEPMDDSETERLVDTTPGVRSPDGYTIIKKLGGGGFGTVFQAFDPRRARMVAIKLIKPRNEHSMDGQKWRDLLISARMELKAASRIRHPGVARVHAVGRDSEDNTYVVQDFIEGRNLKQAMAEVRSWSPVKMVQLMQDITFAVEELHQNGVLHRDLKPANIMLSATDGRPVLVDFGLAHVVEGDGSTLPLLMGGTRAYMAPEQARCESIDDRADIYALGIVFGEILTGERGSSLSRCAKGLSHNVVELVEGMTARVARDRPDARQVIWDLSDLLLDPASLLSLGDSTLACNDDSISFESFS